MNTVFEFSGGGYSWDCVDVSLALETNGPPNFYGRFSTPEYSNDIFPCPFNPEYNCYTYSYKFTYTHPTAYHPDVDEVIFRVIYGGDLYSSLRFKISKITLSQLHAEDDNQHHIDNLTLQPTPYEYDLAADGTTSLVLKYPNIGGLFTIRDAGPTALSGSLSDVSITDYVVETHYTAPETYDPDNDVVYLDYYKSPGDTEPSMTLQLHIKPPPAVLLHGLASEGSWWDPVKNSLEDQGWPSNFIATPNYDNDADFSTQTVVVQNAVDFQLLDLRTSGVFVNKVNLVGYSMGGLLGRQYLLENPDAPVYKFVTLNTPHYGSEWANLVDGQRYQGSFYWLADRWFSNTVDGFDIDAGAMNSLRVDGDAILNLNSQAGPTLPIHAISTDFTACDFFDSDLPGAPSSIRSISKLIRIGSGVLNFVYFAGAAVCAGIDHVLGEEHDGIVRVVSQSGGLEAPYHQNYAGLINTFHTATANQTNIKNEHLPTLLRVSPDESGLFTNGGFVPDNLPAPSLLPDEEQARFNVLLTEVEIDVLQPQPNDTVYAQWMPSLQVEGNENVAGLMALFFYPGLDTMLIDSALWSSSHPFTVPVPQDYEGWVNIGVLGTDGYGTVAFDTLSIFITQGAPTVPPLRPTIYLQGAYDPNTGLMRDHLRAANLLPLTEPYTDLGYAHTGGGGETVTQEVFNVTGPDAVVDWVVVELRDKSDFSSVLATRSALLQRDGDVVDTDGVSPLLFPTLPADDYYVAVRHRNHLGVMTASPVALFSAAATVDFTSDLNNIYGGSNGIAQAGGGLLCLFSGDFNGNGQVQNTDFAAMVLTLGTAGYAPGDFDLNGEVQNTDLQLRLTPNIGRGQAF